ncbi:AMP-binding protein [Micromonospora globbae]|uniref:Long-chain fatty acid--CoA ligase n=1 Tax=Micromonospora globbae TaxID=1894969 RepID=A0A420F215_9ACTN|nr:AMP-binding protein [Micromonospora globbae]RKF27014.1 long-chain fatty acid--CoA ligase [Micromonospora globbae]
MTSLLHADARLVDAATGRRLGGADLADRVADLAALLDDEPPGVVFATAAADIDAVLRILAAWEAGRPVALLDPQITPAALRDLVGRFRPAVLLGAPAPGDGFQPAAAGLGPAWRRTGPAGERPHPDLALLLTTSGSTGNPKLVRLSRTAVQANASAIATALGLDGDEVAPTTLPLHYTYGLSVLTSHLHAGATVLLARTGLTSRDFWTAVDRHGATSLAGVPYQYEMLRRLRFAPARHPRLRTLTQAGGRLHPELVADFHERMAAVGGRLFVMYGQTEATARMTVLPPDRLPGKLGSVGLPVPGGTVSIRADDGTETTEPDRVGEIVYRGANVMMGYAETAADLARPDELGGVLATGDLGRLDADGFLFVTGRIKRIAKVFGVRVNLDDVERSLGHHGPVAAVAGADRLVVVVEGADPDRLAGIRAEVAAALGTHSSGVQVRGVDALPLTPTGKPDYRVLEEQC